MTEGTGMGTGATRHFSVSFFMAKKGTGTLGWITCRALSGMNGLPRLFTLFFYTLTATYQAGL